MRTNITGSGSWESFKDALVIAPFVYLLFCLINFQAGPDLIPLFPFIGVFAGWFLVKLGTWISGSESAGGEGRRVKLGKSLATAALVVIASVVVFRAVTYRYQYGLTLQDQINNLAAVSALLGPDDRIYVHGAVEVLVLLERPNSNPYIFLDWGKDDYIAAQKERGFSSVIDELQSQAPKLVALSRLQKVTHRAELREWVGDIMRAWSCQATRGCIFGNSPDGSVVEGLQRQGRETNHKQPATTPLPLSV